MKWDLLQIAAATGGLATGDATLDTVVTDSREARPGALFVAIRGERLDGHDFLADAVGRGASAVLCEAGRVPPGIAAVEVENTLDSLRRLGEARRAELEVPVVAVTGSSGKTTTKDFIASVLGTGTHAAPRSYNNEVGVPLTILGTPDDAAAVVVEVGSRGRGHIASLRGVIAPDVGVITNIGRAHLEMFGSIEGVLDAKWELIESLESDGVAVLPADDERLTARRTDRVLTFGEVPSSDVRASAVSMDDSGVARFDLHHGSESITVRMPLPGRHQPVNAAAAVAAAVALGRPFAESAARLDTAVISPGRMAVTSVAIGAGRVTIVDDSYNANPDSTEAALRTVAGMPGRRFAVLGKMHELGAYETAAHREIGALARSLGFEVLVVGEDPGLADGAGEGAVSVVDCGEAVLRLRPMLRPGDVVLVKASRAAGLESVVRGLMEVTA